MKLSFLILIIGIYSLMFSRVLVFLGFPSIVNFIHFLIFIGLFFFIIISSRKSINSKLLVYFSLFFFIILMSALINSSGFINVILEYFLYLEPFLLLYSLKYFNLNKNQVSLLSWHVLFIGFVQIIFGLIQWVVTFHNDSVQGTLMGMGAGHHVMGAIVALIALYVYDKKIFSVKMRYVFIFLLLSLIYFSDSKQVVLAFLIAWGFFMLLSSKSIKSFFVRLFLFISSSSLLFLLTSILIPFVLEGSRWSQGLSAKFNVFNLIAINFNSVLNWIFGLGPGHTVGRLAFMIPAYESLLNPLGVTISSFTTFIWDYQQGFWITNSITGSSLFSPFFSWAGLFGDLGFLGLIVYLVISYLSFKPFISIKINKFLFILLFIFGFIFGWLEEPNFMCFFVLIIYLFSNYGGGVDEKIID